MLALCIGGPKGWTLAQQEGCHAGPLAPLYYSGQFVPLIVFFLLFLAIEKDNKLHHYVRFNCMQVSAGRLLVSEA